MNDQLVLSINIEMNFLSHCITEGFQERKTRLGAVYLLPLFIMMGEFTTFIECIIEQMSQGRERRITTSPWRITRKMLYMGRGLMEQSLLAEHILHLEKRLMNYQYQDFEMLLADDFVEFGSSGKSYDKKALLEGLKRMSTTDTITYTVTDFKIKQLASDVILATYQTFRHNDRKYALRSSIWQRKQGEWQMVFHQGTPTK